MNKKQKKILKQVFARPVLASIKWNDVRVLLISLGAREEERSGSRVIFNLNGSEILFHKPHPGKEMDRGAVRSLARFLKEAGIEYNV